MIKAIIKGTTSILLIDLYQEQARSRLYSAILFNHGVQTTGRKPPFDHSEYQACGKEVRCYDGAIDLAQRHNLTYFEGLALLDCEGVGWVPLAHGWCADEYGFIVDPTMSNIQHSNSVHYWGVPIKKSYAHEWNRLHGYYGCLDGTPETWRVGVHIDNPSLWLDKSVQYNRLGVVQ